MINQGRFDLKCVVFEATEVYHRGLEWALGEVGLPYSKINPYQGVVRGT